MTIAVLGIASFYVQSQASNFLTDLDAERAGTELAKSEMFAGLVSAGLLFSSQVNAFRRAELFTEQHEGYRV